MDGFVALMVLTFVMMVIFGGFLAWGLKTRQFHNPEESKYHIFENEKPNQRGGKNAS